MRVFIYKGLKKRLNNGELKIVMTNKSNEKAVINNKNKPRPEVSQVQSMVQNMVQKLETPGTHYLHPRKSVLKIPEF